MCEYESQHNSFLMDKSSALTFSYIFTVVLGNASHYESNKTGCEMQFHVDFQPNYNCITVLLYHYQAD